MRIYQHLAALSSKTNGGKREAATRANVFLQLVGKDGNASEWEKLSSIWRWRFRQGYVDDFELTMTDVGMPVLIRLSEDIRRAISVSVAAKIPPFTFRNRIRYT